MDITFYPTAKENDWLFNVFRHWYYNVRDPVIWQHEIRVAPGLVLNNSNFTKWLKQTYNLEWVSDKKGLYIGVYDKADWMRFMLEWG